MLHSIKRWIKPKVYFSQTHRRCRIGRRRLTVASEPTPPPPVPSSSTRVVHPITHTYAHNTFCRAEFFHTRALRAWLQMRVAVSVSCLCLRGSYKPRLQRTECCDGIPALCQNRRGNQMPLHASLFYGAIFPEACRSLGPFDNIFWQDQDRKGLISHTGSDKNLNSYHRVYPGQRSGVWIQALSGWIAE